MGDHVDGAGSRAVKRLRIEDDTAQIGPARTRKPGSKLFAAYRTVGLVTPTATPFTTSAQGKTSFHITTSVGNALHTYDLKRGLNLVFITRPQTPQQITATLAWRNYIFAAYGAPDTANVGVGIFRRGKKVDELEMPAGHIEPILGLRVLGSWIVGVCSKSVLVWQVASLQHYTTLQAMPGSTFTGVIAIISTLLNKVLVGKDDGSVEIWNVSTGRLVYTMLPQSSTAGPVTALEPVPALGLVAVGYTDGNVVIRDVCTDEQVVSVFAGAETQTATPITSIAFRTDGLGAGDDGRRSGVMATASLFSGDITLWDLNDGGRKAGVLRGAHAAPSKIAAGGVTKIEFLHGQAVLVSSGLDNHLNTWVFDETPFSPVPRPLHSRGGHGGSITRLDFLPSASDGSDMSGKWLLASSQDRSLWGWSLRRDGQSSEISQGAIKKKAKKSGIMASAGRDFLETLKASPITSMACSLNRDGGMGAIPGKLPIWQSASSSTSKTTTSAESSGMTGWESIITSHEDDSKARTWFWGRKRAGRWAFETSDKTPVRSVAISPCGTFAALGSFGGAIDVHNLQSGIHRQRFPPRLTAQQAKTLKTRLSSTSSSNIDLDTDSGRQTFYRGQGKHSAPVTGLAVDNLNKTLLSADTAGKLKIWSFSTGTLLHDLDLGAGVLGLKLHRGSELLCLSCADGVLRVLDPSTRKIVRELRATRLATSAVCGVALADFAFSQDGRWIVAAVKDTVLLWDLPTGHLVDAFRLGAGRVSAVAFSPTGEYLATAGEGRVGVEIWSNKALYTHIPTRHVGEQELEEILAAAPEETSTAGEAGMDLVAMEDSEDEDDDMDGQVEIPVTEADLAGLSSDLLSLSLVPRSRWQNLLYLDTIRARNKPVAPPQKPEKAPFFLPSIAGAQPQPLALDATASRATEIMAQDAAQLAAERSRIARMDREGGASATTRLLRAAADDDTPEALAAVTAHFKTLGPSAADIEIRSLSRTGRINEHVAFLASLVALLERRRDFELVQAWMAVYLKVHGDVVVQDAAVREVLVKWQGVMQGEKQRITRLVEYCGGMVGYLRAGRV